MTVGEFSRKRGDYMFLNFEKVPNMNDYMALEQKVWKLMAERWTFGSVGKIRDLAHREVRVVEQRVTRSSVTSRR